MAEPELSILVLTTPRRRRHQFQEILDDLESQARGRENLVEVLGLYDNKARSVGAKRTGLLRIARGRFVTFVDDDDRVHEKYVSKLLDTIEENPDVDVICFDQCSRTETGPWTRCLYGLEYQYGEIQTPLADGTCALWTGLPAHTMVWRRALIADLAFPDENYHEDVHWVLKAAERAKTQARIPEILYWYTFDPKISETR